jgi:pimeloyl-ACP methyl ester carboxylesterase
VFTTLEDRRARLNSIQVPTVVVHGSEDPHVALEAGSDVAASMPGAELRVIEGMGHDMPVALVTNFADAIVAAAKRATGPVQTK